MQVVTESTSFIICILNEKTEFREVMGVLRMIKLFGWERRAQKDIEEKREVELNFIKKRALYALVNHNIT